MFLRTNLELLLEGDFVIKLWAPLIERLFLGSQVCSHRGDTVPAVFKHGEGKQPKINLRLICIGTLLNIMAPRVSLVDTHSKKYYQDKEKLAIVANAQLNEIIKTYHLTQEEGTRIYINTIQVLGTQAEISVL
ncbi:hypothetical protein BDA99DRAFT_514083 [Phascolomyces articulosus]|uniref:Uncharacterized protein n=1 Tax=Phascolomyces articulosus TaxID=60185 RepID=A0AAD5K776_9FUNG|nr:hypothetical protein BDA99DRAFT_514083 [Phascolomyces articulosus]